MEISKKLIITDWAPEDRPREKMMIKGAKSLSNAELLAILIGSGNIAETALELSQRILQSNGNDLNKLGKCSVEELCKFKGIGKVKAIGIAAALEIGKRRKAATITQSKTVKTSKDVHDYFHPLLSDLPHEELWLLLINRANKIIEGRMISKGGISETTVDIRLILKPALELLASGIILCHNHPSGHLAPSKQDDLLTRKVKDAARMLDIDLLDHVIVADDLFFSYADEGRI